MATNLKGRPRRYAEYDQLFKELPKPMGKRPKYVKGIGIFRGTRGDTAWIKIRLPHGGSYNGKHHPKDSSLEIKLGSLSSWSWDQLERRRDEIQGRADRGDPLQEEAAPSFDQFAESWLARAAQRRIKAHETATVHVTKHLIPFFGNRPISSIATIDVNRWIARQLDPLREVGRLKPATVKRQLNTLKAVFNDALKSGYLDTNPCRYADPIRGIEPRQRYLSGEEIVHLLAKSEEVAEWLPDLILWCVHSGMRKNEVRSLEWSDIQSLGDGRMFAMVRTSKTDQPRMVSCTNTMIEVLKRQERRKVDGNKCVFPVPAMTLRRKWEKARKLAGLLEGDDNVTLHDLRRTHGTHAAAAGVDLRTLAGRIGHADLTMLQKHYAALVGSADEQAAMTFQQAFDKMTAKAKDAAPNS